MVEQIMVLEKCEQVTVKHLPANISRRRGTFVFSSNGNGHSSLSEIEQKYIQFVLHQTGGIRHQAADILQINRKTLSAKIKKYGLDSKDTGA